MRGAIKFSHLPLSEKRLLIKAAFLLWAIRLGLWLFSFKTLRRILARSRRTTVRFAKAEQVPLERIVWMIEVASRWVPAATCLTQAIATLMLLSRFGYPARLRIGVAKSETGLLQAHAWVESDGRVIIGGLPNLSRFCVLSPLREDIL